MQSNCLSLSPGLLLVLLLLLLAPPQGDVGLFMLLPMSFFAFMYQRSVRKHFEDPVPWVRTILDERVGGISVRTCVYTFLFLFVCLYVFVQLPRETEQNSDNVPRPIYFSDWKPENWHRWSGSAEEN